MTCHFHDLLESIKENKILCIDPIEDEEFNEILGVVNSVASEVICFDMGDIDEMPNISPVYEMVKEPFPTTWYECDFTHTDGTKIIIGLLVIVRDHVQILSFRRKNKVWCIRGVIVADTLSSWQKFGLFPPVEIVGQELKQHKLVLSVFLSALNCKNVNKVEHIPQEKLQKARIKKGKLPLYSHWTLEILLPEKSNFNSSSSGSGKSPRVHLRRGHPRQYAPERYTWVQACMVGKNKGIVTKEYSAKFIKDETEET